MGSKRDYNAEIGKRIKERRMSLGMTQQDLAFKLGFKTRQSISSIESGINGLDTEQLKLIAQHLNCSIEFLMGWDVNDEKEEALAQISSELSGMDEAQLKTMLKFAKLINKGEI